MSKAKNNLGFTGTRSGCTPEQLKELQTIATGAKQVGYTHFLYGDCLGADEQAFAIFKAARFMTVCYPPSNPKLRAFTKADAERDPTSYLDRNKRIVNDSKILIACPRQKNEILRSGTWSTIRYALALELPVIIIFPDVEVKMVNL